MNILRILSPATPFLTSDDFVRTFWFGALTGKILVDDEGRPIFCGFCPCDDTGDMTPCCPSPLPATLFTLLDFTFDFGAGAVHSLKTVVVVYDPALSGVGSSRPGAWYGSDVCNGKSIEVLLYCTETGAPGTGQMVYELYCDGHAVFAPPRIEPGYAGVTNVTCSPFYGESSTVSGDPTTFEGCCDGTAAAFIRLDVTFSE